MPNTSRIDEGLFREVLGHYPTGVVAITGVDPEGELHAMVVGTFTSVSLDPPLIGFLPRKESQTYQRLRRCPTLCVNILTTEQEKHGRALASRWQDKFEGIDWFASPGGAPVLKDSLAWIDVTVVDEVDAGDHWFTLCRVDDLAVLNPITPLLFFQGGYGSFIVPSLVARMTSDIREFVVEAGRVRDELEELVAQVNGECMLMANVNPDELVAVASATASGVNPGEGLGEHVPMVPPIGDTAHCTASEEEIEYWLSKAKGVDAEALQVFRDRLEFCREHGYVLSFLPEGDETAYDQMREAAAQFARGLITPAQERAVRAAIVESGVRYEPREITDGETYDLGSIVVPIFDSENRTRYTLRVHQLPRKADADSARAWVAATKATAARIAERLGLTVL